MDARRNPILVIAVALFSLAAFDASAQAGATTSLGGDGDFFLGGGIGFGFGSVDYIELSPIFGYRPIERLDVGVGLTFRWADYDWYGRSENGTDYGFTLFSDYFIWRGLFARAEYEYLSYEEPLPGGGTDRTGYNAFKLGGGYALPLGRNAALYFTGLYNFSYDDRDSPYGDPWEVNAGVSFGF